jgi:hypothetical protein
MMVMQMPPPAAHIIMPNLGTVLAGCSAWAETASAAGSGAAAAAQAARGSNSECEEGPSDELAVWALQPCLFVAAVVAAVIQLLQLTMVVIL